MFFSHFIEKKLCNVKVNYSFNREREKLRIEREKLERQKQELLRLEREHQRLEREKLEREREELRRQQIRFVADDDLSLHTLGIR